jgi:hypothetical protein
VVKEQFLFGWLGSPAEVLYLACSQHCPSLSFFFQEAMVTSPEFRAYYGSDNIRSIIDLFEKLLEE